MIVSIHQPQYLPWLGFFAKVARSGLWVILDHAQYHKNDFFNRNRVRTSQGWTWLTVPVSFAMGDAFDTVRTDTRSSWEAKHWNTLKTSYGRAPYFRTYAPRFEEIYARAWNRLIDIDLATTELCLELLDIKTPTVRASTLQVDGKASELLLNICRKVKTSEYLSGDGGRAYLDEGLFRENGITVTYQRYQHPAYKQVHGDFIPHMSIVDLLFNHGPESRSILEV